MMLEMSLFQKYCAIGLAIAGSVSLCSNLAAQAPREIKNSIGMKLVLIPKGSFTMGSPVSEEGSGEDEIEHQVTLSRDFYLGVTEVTQSQYQKVMGSNPSFFQGENVADREPRTDRVVKEVDSSNHPVDQISWDDAMDFCSKLSALPEEKMAGRVYRLPTEAEWEYACRAGSKAAYCFGGSVKTLERYTWFGNNSGRRLLDADAIWKQSGEVPLQYIETLLLENCRTHAVGGKLPNAWGLHDMHGNIREWCSDWYGEYPKRASIDPVGPKSGELRVLRGGSWDLEGKYCRSAKRGMATPTNHRILDGVRVALSPDEKAK